MLVSPDESLARTLPVTPLDALGPNVREEIVVAGRNFVLTRPDAVERLIDHPVLGGATASAEYMPYWATLWPAARLLAEAVLRENWQARPLSAVEIGCGLGMPGIAALARGLRVTFSDYDATALLFAGANAKANGFHEFGSLVMDYRQPPPGLSTPIVLGADLIYETHLASPLAVLIRRILAPQGLALIADMDRVPAAAFREALRAEALSFTTAPLEFAASECVARSGTLYRIRHADRDSPDS